MKLRSLMALLLCLPTTGLLAQEREMRGDAPVPELSPSSIGKEFDFSPAAKKAFAENPDNETFNNIYDILGEGCSFYCCMPDVEVVASSSLPKQGQYDYSAQMAHDHYLNTAWVEGKEDDGCGEWLEIQLQGTNPEICQVHVVAGIVTSRDLWQKNNRPEVLMMSINGKPHCALYLKDVYATQTFDIPVIPAGTDSSELLNIRFSICAVYPGTKYHDTCITDIYFDGPCH